MAELSQQGRIEEGAAEDALEKECRGRIYARIRNHTGGNVTYPPNHRCVDGAKISDAAKDIIRMLLQPVPKNRMSCNNFLRSQWFSDS